MIHTCLRDTMSNLITMQHSTRFILRSFGVYGNAGLSKDSNGQSNRLKSLEDGNQKNVCPRHFQNRSNFVFIYCKHSERGSNYKIYPCNRQYHSSSHYARKSMNQMHQPQLIWNRLFHGNTLRIQGNENPSIQIHRMDAFNASKLTKFYSTKHSNISSYYHSMPLTNHTKRRFHTGFPRKPSSCVELYNSSFIMTKEQKQQLEELISFHPIQVFATQFPLSNKSTRETATNLFNHWRLSPESILIYLSLDERRVELITGKNAHHVVSPEFLASILESRILPEMKKQKFYEGFAIGISSIINRMQAHEKFPFENDDNINYISVETRKMESKMFTQSKSKEKTTATPVEERNSISVVTQIHHLNHGSTNEIPPHNLLPEEIHPIPSVMIVSLLIILVILLYIFAKLLTYFLRPRCPKCGSRNSTPIVDCNDLLSLYYESLKDAHFEGEKRVDEDFLKSTTSDYTIRKNLSKPLDEHGSSTTYFSDQISYENLHRCIANLEEKNWKEIEIDAVTFTLRKCEYCFTAFVSQVLSRDFSLCNSCRCRGRTKIKEEIISYPTEYSAGSKEIHFQCKICNKAEIETRSIPQKHVNRSTGGGSSSTGFGGSGSFGTGSGGGF